MKISESCNKITLLTLILFTFAGFSFGQHASFKEPREETLLNGLKVLIWHQPNAEKVSVKLRIHSGSAFDPKDKMGTMALLGEILLPDEGVKTFFEEELGGDIEILNTYDYIQINATANPGEFLTILETLAPAVINPAIDKETTEKIKARQLKIIKELEKDPKYIAKTAAAEKLFGDFPYGRPAEGTEESLSKIDFADIILAKQRFLTSDNATLAISGNVRSNFAYLAARRLFGGWTKANEKTPAYFRRPENPDTKLFVKPTEAEGVSELRFTFKTLARNDKSFYAANILSEILSERMNSGGAFILQKNLLPSYGIYIFSEWNVDTVKMTGDRLPLPESIDHEVAKLFSAPITEAEFNKAKNTAIRNFADMSADELWLDMDTYKLSSVKDEFKMLENVKFADVKDLATKWKKEPLAKALVVSKVEETTLPQDVDPVDPEK